jgi:hypothetical protein
MYIFWKKKNQPHVLYYVKLSHATNNNPKGNLRSRELKAEGLDPIFSV